MPAPAVLGAVFLLSLLAPSLTARLGRWALLGLAVAPAAITGWFAALLPQVLHGKAVRRAAGAAMSLFAGLAVLRFGDTLCRIHAATKPQVLGVVLLMIGLGLRLGTAAVIGELLLIVVLQFLTAPVSAHLAVRVAYRDRGSADVPSQGSADDPDVPSSRDVSGRSAHDQLDGLT